MAAAIGIIAMAMVDGRAEPSSFVAILRVTGKLKRTGRYPAGRQPSWKKAVVTLSEDSKSIEFFEGMA